MQINLAKIYLRVQAGSRVVCFARVNNNLKLFLLSQMGIVS